MAKRTVNFRFSEEADARLKELAAEREQTRTQVLEDLILGRPPPYMRDDVKWHMVTGSPGKAPDETRPSQIPAEKGRGSLKRTEAIPKPDWKK